MPCFHSLTAGVPTIKGTLVRDRLLSETTTRKCCNDACKQCDQMLKLKVAHIQTLPKSSLYLNVMFSFKRSKSYNIFTFLLLENLSPITFKNRPIWSHCSRKPILGKVLGLITSHWWDEGFSFASRSSLLVKNVRRDLAGLLGPEFPFIWCQ